MLAVAFQAKMIDGRIEIPQVVRLNQRLNMLYWQVTKN